MAYNLVVDGFRDFSRSVLSLEQQSISRDPLIGIVDGSNKVFHTNYAPVLTSGCLGVYVNGSLVPAMADYNTGRIELTSAPSYQPLADYTFTPYTTTQMLQFMLKGFGFMEGFWQRGYRLVDTSGSPANETSDAILVVDSSGNDPSVGSTYFSQSISQIAYLMACCDYALVSIQLTHSARTSYMWRETVRGMTVDKTDMPKNLRMALEAVKEQMDALQSGAMEEIYGEGSEYGGAILGPVTLGYLLSYEWQTDSKLWDYRTQLGYHWAYRPTVY